eukprot:gene18398-20253_t
MTSSDKIVRSFVKPLAWIPELCKMWLKEENPQAVIDELAVNLPVVTRGVNGGARFCEICQCIKPDRCHHCSMCNRFMLQCSQIKLQRSGREGVQLRLVTNGFENARYKNVATSAWKQCEGYGVDNAR